jgi:predicted phage tail protein
MSPVVADGRLVSPKEVTVPLSEHEQKLLEQMERAMYAEDPKFATQMKGSAAKSARRRMIAGAAIVVVGLALVVLGVTTELIIVGGLGFAVMVGGVAWALTPVRQAPTLVSVSRTGDARQTAAKGSKAKKPKKGRGGSGTLIQRMEQRWERRRERGPW